MPTTKIPAKKSSKPDMSTINLSAPVKTAPSASSVKTSATVTPSRKLSITEISNSTKSISRTLATKTPTPRTLTTKMPSTEEMVPKMPSLSVTGKSQPTSLSRKRSIPEISNTKSLIRETSSNRTPNYACTVIPSICRETFSNVNLWIKHELSPDHNFLLSQTEWLCAYRATKELPLPLGRNNERISGGCNLAFNSPDGLSKHWKEKNETGMFTEFRIGKDVQRFWCGFCQKVHIIGLSGHYSWDKGRIDHIREHFEGLPGQPETKWKIGQWKEYKNVDDAKWKDLAPLEWK